MASKPLTWRQTLVLKAALQVDYLPVTSFRACNIPYGVFRALVYRGFLRQTEKGWEATDKGRDKGVWLMGKKARYYVAQDGKDWLVCDRRKYKMQNDVVSKWPNRESARISAKRLNEFERDIGTDGQLSREGETI